MDEKSWSGGVPNQVIDNCGRNHGTSYDNATTTADGIIGRAGVFDGDGDYVEVPDSGTLDITDSITIGAWVKKAGYSGDEHNTILQKPYAYEILCDLTGQVWWALGTTNYWKHNATGYILPDDEWHHLALVYDKDSGGAFYVDGAAKSTIAADGAISATVENLYLGGNPALNWDFNGLIDEVKIWNYKLSATEISSIDQIRQEALAPNSETNHPLPLMSSWNSGSYPYSAEDWPDKDAHFSPNWQMQMIAQGHHLLPWFAIHGSELPESQPWTEQYCQSAMQKIGAWGLPMVFLSTQWEQYLYSCSGPYLDWSYPNNPNVIDPDTMKAAKPPKISPFGPLGPWSEIGNLWATCDTLKKCQTWYPNPPLVIFLSNNEANILGWACAGEDKHYLDLHGTGQSGQDKRIAFAQGWIERYRALQQAWKDGLTSSAWKNNSIFVGYGGLKSAGYGYYPGWETGLDMLYSDTCFDPSPLIWDGNSSHLYLASTDNTDYQAYGHQMFVMNQVFVRDEAYQLNPNYWLELSVWNGCEIYPPVGEFGDILASWGYTPERYAGLVQFGMWLLRPRVVRDFRGWTTPRVDAQPYFDALLAVVDNIYVDKSLQKFWRNSQLVANTSHPHPFHDPDNIPADMPTKYLDGNINRMFMLDTNLDPTNWWDDQTGKTVLPVFALARVKGVTPNRQWLVYAFAPQGPLNDVEVTIPGYANTVTVNATAGGSFYLVDEASQSVQKVNAPPTVDITNPENNALIQLGNNIDITVRAADRDGTIERVEIYQNCKLLYTDFVSPYSYSWTPTAAGTYVLSAKVYDDDGVCSRSKMFRLQVNTTVEPPVVNITSPSNGAVIVDTEVTLNATASSSNSTIMKVAFYQNGIRLNTDYFASDGYSYIWKSISPGDYELTAKAYDAECAYSVSPAVNIRVNNPPLVQITSPLNNAVFTGTGLVVDIEATASDTDGAVSKVEFLDYDYKIGEDSSSPFTYAWSNPSYGDHSLKVKAYDNDGGYSVSAAAKIEVNVASGLVSYWHMDETNWNGSPNEVIDYCGRNHGKSHDNATTTINGIAGRAGTFDGDGDYVEVPDSPDSDSLDITDSITICAWVKRAGGDDHSTILQKADAYEIITNHVGQVWWALGTTGKEKHWKPHFTGYMLPDNEWHHLALVYDKDSDGAFFVDGEIKNTIKADGAISATEEDLYLGGHPTLNWDFNGLLDEIRLYKRALSASEIAALYAGG